MQQHVCKGVFIATQLNGTGTLRCLQKEMATYRHWSVSLWRDPDDVSHCRILSPDKTEWRLISATLCGWRRCFVADQLWLMTRIREEEEICGTALFTIQTTNTVCQCIELCHRQWPWMTFEDHFRYYKPFRCLRIKYNTHTMYEVNYNGRSASGRHNNDQLYRRTRWSACTSDKVISTGNWIKPF